MFVKDMETLEHQCHKCLFHDSPQDCDIRECAAGYKGHYVPEEPCNFPEVHEETPLDTQVGGAHYKSMVIQPVEFCQKNQLNHCESSIVKYACRHKSKGGAEDIKKIIHYAQLILQLEYPEEL